MSFKTTLVLALLAALAASALWFVTRGDPPISPTARRLFGDLAVADVQELSFEVAGETPFAVVRRKDGFVVRRAGDRDRSARAEQTDAAIRALTSAVWLKERPDVVADKDQGFGLDASGRRSAILRRADGRVSRIDFGAEVRSGVVVALIDGRRPAVEVDSGVATDVLRAYDAWIDARLVGLDAGLVKGVRIFDRADGAPTVRLVSESARWFLREPELARADQATADRMTAFACAVETVGPWPVADGAGPQVRFRVEFELRDGAKATIAVGAEATDGLVPARREPDGVWERVPEEFARAFAARPADLRTRRLLDVEATQIAEVLVRSAGADERRYLRRTSGFVFVAPDAWNWRRPAHLNPGVPPEALPVEPFPLDPTAASLLTEGLAEWEVASWGGDPPAAADLVIVVRTADAAGVPTAERTLTLGPAVDGRRRASISGSAADVRASDAAFLEKPFFSRLARVVTDTLPHCITEIEVVEPGGRSVALRATGVAAGKFTYERTDSARPDAVKRVAPEASEALRAKLAALTVREHVAFSTAPEGTEFGLDAPRYVIRFKDTVQAYEGNPDLKARGGWIVWRVGKETSGGLRFGSCDRRPGLVFTTEPRDLDPVIDLLNLGG